MIDRPTHRDPPHRFACGALSVIVIGCMLAETASARQGEPPPAKNDIISVARKEAERESATLNAQVKDLLRYLMLKTDAADPAIESRIEELAHIGSVGVPQLLGAMDYPENSPPESAAPLRNAGINAARAIARIPGQAVSASIVKMSRDGSIHGRRNAAIALGLRADINLYPALRDLVDIAKREGLSQGEKDIVTQALIAVGLLGGNDVPQLLERFIAVPDVEQAAAAIAGLTRVEKPSDSITAAVLNRLIAELASNTPNDPVIAAALVFHVTHPRHDALEPAGKTIADPLRSADARAAASHALRAIARKYDNLKRKALSFMLEALNTSSGGLLEEVALDLRELGDDSGVDAVVDPLSKQIKEDSKNFGLLYSRGETYFRMREFKLAKRDLLEGLKKEKDPRQPERLYVTLARCSLALDEAREAGKWLKEFEEKSGDQDFSLLAKQYPEFAAMAKDPQFEKLFAPKLP